MYMYMYIYISLSIHIYIYISVIYIYTARLRPTSKDGLKVLTLARPLGVLGLSGPELGYCRPRENYVYYGTTFPILE